MKRNCFSEIGTSVTSVAAIAVALRAPESITAHFAEDAVVLERIEQPVSDTDFHFTALDDKQLMRRVALLEDHFTGLERSRRRLRVGQNAEIDRCFCHFTAVVGVCCSFMTK